MPELPEMEIITIIMVTKCFNRNAITYLVRQDGYANLPLLGEIHIAGKTIVELENDLKERLSPTTYCHSSK